MTEMLTPGGYEQTKEKLADMEQRLNHLARRTDLSPQHQIGARRSYERMIAQYRRELKLYEAAHPESTTKS
jgi:hypothetical protein